MKTFVVLATILAAATAAPSVTIQKIGYGPSSIVRAPAHDSASIESHRLGGNFAYATAEAHAYASVTPEISEATHPVAETTYTNQPAPIAHVQPAPIVKTTHAARPIFGQQAILAQEPVIGPVAHHTTVEQPIYRQQHVTVQQPHAVVAPAVETIGYAGAYGYGLPAAAAGYGIPAAAGYGLPAGYGLNGAILA